MRQLGPVPFAGRTIARHARDHDRPRFGPDSFPRFGQDRSPGEHQPARQQQPARQGQSAGQGQPARQGQPGPQGQQQPAQARPPAPPTIALVISRRARRDAAEAAAAASQVDPRIEIIERVLAGVQTAGNVLVAGLCVLGWIWLGAQGSVRADTTGAITNEVAAGSNPLIHPLAAASGTTLVLILLAACLLMAPVVNPFYAPPAERRGLHTSTTVLFGVLAVTTVAVIAGAAR